MTIAMTDSMLDDLSVGAFPAPPLLPAVRAGSVAGGRPAGARVDGRRSPGRSPFPVRRAVARADRGRARPPALFDRSEVSGAVSRGRRESIMGEDGAVVTARASVDRASAGRASVGRQPVGPRVVPTGDCGDAGGGAAGRRSVRAARPVAPVAPAALSLLADASLGLGRACAAGDPADRYAIAHLAALRGGAAVLAARARPTRGRQGSVWTLMTKVAPEFDEWAAFFAAGSAKRQAVQAGLPAGVTPREADDLVRQVALFLSLVGESLGAPDGTAPH